jgi:hypothetical protein
MQAVTIQTIDQLTNAVRGIFASTETRWWFRCQRDQKWPLLPSVRRGYSKQQERYLTNLFYTRARTRRLVRICPMTRTGSTPRSLNVRRRSLDRWAS